MEATRLKNASYCATIVDGDAEIEDMRQKIEAKKRQLRVKEAIVPHIRGSDIKFVYDPQRDRYRFRIPLAISRSDSSNNLSGKTESELYDKLFAYLFGDELFTIRALFGEVLKRKEEDPDCASLTVTRYRQIWEKYYEDNPLVDRKITDIKASDIKQFFKYLTIGRNLSRKNFVNIKSILNAAYDLAVERDIITGNLARSINCKDLKFKAVNNDNVRYTDEDRNKILDYLDHMTDKSDYEYAIELMFCLCIRIGELCALRWTDLDERQNTITIAREIVLRENDKGKNRFVEVNHTKGGEHGERVLPLSERAMRVLNALNARLRTSDDAHIFVNRAGQPLDRNKFNIHLKRITESVGIPYLSSHKIRFWSVTALARATGGDIQTVMYAAGHADKNTTLHYIRAVRSDTQLDAIRACLG